MLENNLQHNNILIQMFIGILIPVLLIFTYAKLVVPLLKRYNERKKQCILFKKIKTIVLHPLIEFRIKTALDECKKPIFYLEYRNAEYELWKMINFYRNKTDAEKQLNELKHKQTLVANIEKDKQKISVHLKEKIYQKINNKTTSN